MPALDPILRNLDETAQAFGWDAAPVLVSLRGAIDDAQVSRMYLVSGGWPGDWIANLVTAHPKEFDSCLGIVLISEGWAYPREVAKRIGDLTDLEERRAGLLAAGPPSEHPDRLEIRSYLAVLRDGSTFYAVRVRGDEGPLDLRLALPGEVRGGIPELLRSAMGLS